MNKLSLSLAGVAGLSLAGLTFAAAAPVAAPMYHWYVGVGLNHFAGTADKQWVGESNEDNPIYEKLSSSKLGYNVFVGNRVTNHFGTELGLNMIGNRMYKTTYTTGKDPVSYAEYSKVRSAWNVYYDGIFTFPVYQNFAVYGKAGINYYSAKQEMYYVLDKTKSDNNPTNELKSFGWNYGGGIQFTYNQFGIRGDYTHMNFANHQEESIYTRNFMPTNLVGVDVFYAFG